MPAKRKRARRPFKDFSLSKINKVLKENQLNKNPLSGPQRRGLFAERRRKSSGAARRK